MKTFQISGGDFVLSNGSFATVTGKTKIQQDLGTALATEYGTDRFHPRYGSTLPNYIGQTAGSGTKILVQSEVTRVVNNYASIQQANINSYLRRGLQAPYSQSEVIAQLNAVAVQQDYDTFEVAAVITTQAGQSTSISASVTPTSVTTGN